MIMNRHLRENILIMLTFLIAMALMILPLPHWALYARPQWVFVVLLFWLIYAPRKVGPFIAWCIGLYVDLLMGDLLGEHALIFVLFSYVVQRYLRVIQAMPVWQQTLAVGVGTFLCITLELLLLKLTHTPVLNWSMLLSVIANMVVWPWLYFLCRDVRPTHDYRLLHSR
ncbi:MAG: rod shape-determining protein MreD [Coxiella sp. (in: Bacteria)]|nr:MAG: rod shape-determining protein MreD [Coxiella sp. (in: g-proteobacteria)]